MSFIHTRFNKQSLLSPQDKVSDEQLVEEAKIVAFQRQNALLRNRRRFLSTLAVAGAAAGTLGLAGCSNDAGPTTTLTPQPTGSAGTIVDVLNFALNLEYFEANFYTYLSTGSGLSASIITNFPSGAGAVMGGAKYTATDPVVQSLIQQLAQHEQEHVNLLISTISSLGGTPVAQPALNLAAMGTPGSDAMLVALARELESVGVSAYEGGVPLLVSNTAILSAAAVIHDTEAQHEGFMREYCIKNGITSPAVDAYDTPPTLTTVFNTSPTTGLNPVRTPAQVLGIVYGVSTAMTTNPPANVTSGGFFPSGMTGAITSTSFVA